MTLKYYGKMLFYVLIKLKICFSISSLVILDFFCMMSYI